MHKFTYVDQAYYVIVKNNKTPLSGMSVCEKCMYTKRGGPSLLIFQRKRQANWEMPDVTCRVNVEEELADFTARS